MSETERNQSKKQPLNGDEIQSISQKELQRQAARAILEEGIGFKIKGLPHFIIYPLTNACRLHISKDALNIEKIPDGILKINVIGYAKQAKPMARIVAKAILRKTFLIKLFTKPLAWLINEHTTGKDLFELIEAIISLSDADFFFDCTNLTFQMRIMEPKAMKET